MEGLAGMGRIRALINGSLLGRRVEAVLLSGDIERGVVVNITIYGDRSITLTDERASDYDPKLEVWIPKRPRREWTRKQDEIDRLTVIDFVETKDGEGAH